MGKLEGKVAIVTGGNSGIGLGMAGANSDPGDGGEGCRPRGPFEKFAAVHGFLPY